MGLVGRRCQFEPIGPLCMSFAKRTAPSLSTPFKQKGLLIAQHLSLKFEFVWMKNSSKTANHVKQRNLQKNQLPVRCCWLYTFLWCPPREKIVTLARSQPV